jgi:uncharacterized protein YndB with AHSA1/START domain
MRVERSIDIAAPPEKVWPFLAESEKFLKWWTTVRKFEYTGEQHSGVGTRFYVEEKCGGPLMKLNFEITEWVENEKIAFKMASGTGVKGYGQRWILEATPSGSRFTLIEDVELPFGIIGKFIGWVGQGSTVAYIKEYLVKLKSLAEA